MDLAENYTNSHRRFFIIGDSISVHYGPHLARMLAGRMAYGRAAGAAPAGEDPAAVGGNGGDSRKVLAFLQDEQSRGVRYDVLLVNCGLHDIKTNPQTGEINVRIDEYERNLRQTVTIARPMAAAVFWVRTTAVEDERHNRRVEQFKRYGRDAEAYNAVADAVMAETGVPMIDLDAFTRNLPPDKWVDHVHYAEPARALQAAFIAGHLWASAQGQGDA